MSTGIKLTIALHISTHTSTILWYFLNKSISKHGKNILWNGNRYENVAAISKRIWSHCAGALSNSIKHSFTTRMESRRLVEPHEYGWVKRLLWLSIKISLWKDFFRAFFGFIINVKAGKKGCRDFSSMKNMSLIIGYWSKIQCSLQRILCHQGTRHTGRFDSNFFPYFLIQY